MTNRHHHKLLSRKKKEENKKTPRKFKNAAPGTKINAQKEILE